MKIPAGLSDNVVTVDDLIATLRKIPSGTPVFHYTEMCGNHGYSHPGVEMHGDFCILNYRWDECNDIRIYDNANGDSN